MSEKPPKFDDMQVFFFFDSCLCGKYDLAQAA